MQENTESLVKEMRKLYERYGYSQYKMNKFEEYDTYVKNKDFLVSDKVITFTDTNGKLLAMKPDVTISIIKNTDDSEKSIQKLYYNENVYRVSGGSNSFKEIMQSGLECIGDIDTYSKCEVVVLAVKSLMQTGREYVLDISHMGLISEFLTAAELTGGEQKEILKLVSEKNMPAVLSACNKFGLAKMWEEKISSLITLSGPIEKISAQLSSLCINKKTEQYVEEIKEICSVLSALGLSGKVNLDFSVAHDMNYYSGIVFKGYVSGVPSGVLSGGQYDKLMEKMGKKSKAIGFAVYLDLLEKIFAAAREYDADVLLLYDEKTPALEIAKKMEEITREKKTVIAQKQGAEKIKCREVITMCEGAAE